MNDITKEVDVGVLQAIFEKTLNTIVAATELSKQVEGMKADLEQMHRDFDDTRNRNVELDRLLADTRRQRDEAEQNLREVKGHLLECEHDRVRLSGQHETDIVQISQLSEAIATIKSERDDYGIKQIEAEDRAKAAESTLRKLREAMGIKEPEPAPKPVEPTPVQSEPEPYKEPRRIYEGDPDYHGYKYDNLWDSEKRLNYHH